jgi:hypothetical protein
MSEPYFDALRETGEAWDEFREFSKQDRKGWTDVERTRLMDLWVAFQEAFLKLKTLQEARV